MESFSATAASPSSAIGPGKIEVAYESNETTHFSVVDADGNAVSNTYTLNFGYGSHQMAEGTGILLNNEMDDFSAKPGVPNAYGLVGGEANAIEPEKRMLNSMSPTIVMKNDELFLVTGSPGGSTIITTVLQMVLNTAEHTPYLDEATSMPRFYHQWLPDVLRLEEDSLLDVQVKSLERLGHEVQVRGQLGTTNIVMVQDGALFGVADPRGTGIAVGY